MEGKKVYPIFIDTNENILSMPPIINSDDVGKVDEDTKEVFIECSGFDYDVLAKCLNIIVTALADMGGEIYEIEIRDEKNKISPDLNPSEEKIDIKYVNKMLGLELKENEMKDLLERMGYNYSKGIVEIPSYRADILHEVDLIEDVAIAYGYENFKEEIPNVSTVASESEISKFKRKISEILIGLKLLECYTYSLSNKINLNQKMNSKTESIEVESPVNSDYDTLRSWMIPSLLQILKENKRYEYPQDLFEISTIFESSEKTETGVEESQSLAVVKCEGNFTHIRQILDSLLSSLNLEYEIEESYHSSFIEGRVGDIVINKEKVGFLGELSPEVLTNWNLEMPVSALELNLSELIKLKKI